MMSQQCDEWYELCYVPMVVLKLEMQKVLSKKAIGANHKASKKIF